MRAGRCRVAATAALAVAALWTSGCATNPSQPAATEASTPPAVTTSAAPASLPAGDRPAALVGRWTSTADAADTITFGSDGSVTRGYTGRPTYTGTWVVAGPESSPDLPPGTTVLVIADDGYPEPVRYVVLAVTAQELSLSFLPRGNTLTYVR